jgi:mono/diheme cytochrome c family protein
MKTAFLSRCMAMILVHGALATLCEQVVAQEWNAHLSCASATCHGGVIGRGPAWNHSYSVSRSLDPHAGAGALLYDSDSKRIVKALAPTADAPEAYDVVLRERCIACHLTSEPEDIVSKQRLDPRQVGEGVSCASCHGSSKGWLEQHVLASWSGPARFEPSTGMLDTESLVSRTDGCVRCHVGSRTADGLVRDMNHDLIAAGHPALRFDMLTYHDNMPHHWDDQGEVELRFSESPWRVRTVGRSLAIAAAAKLSGERAADSLESTARDTSAKRLVAPVPWPELSDFDCFACHQTLTARAYRLPKLIDGKPSLAVSDGLPLWNAWHTSPLAAAGDEQLWDLRPSPGKQDQWIEASQRISSLYREKAMRDAEASVPTDIFNQIQRNLGTRAPADWHAAAAIYLELEAATRELLLKPETRDLGVRAAELLNKTVAPLLRFDRDETSTDHRMRSPRDFDPREFRDATLNALISVYEVQP